MDKKGTIHIKRLQKKKGDDIFIVEGASLIRFMNKGQTAVMIDEQEIIEPGQSFTEGDITGPGIYHEYKLDFIPAETTPNVVPHKVFTGNMLKIRAFYRKK